MRRIVVAFRTTYQTYLARQQRLHDDSVLAETAAEKKYPTSYQITERRRKKYALSSNTEEYVYLFTNHIPVIFNEVISDFALR